MKWGTPLDYIQKAMAQSQLNIFTMSSVQGKGVSGPPVGQPFLQETAAVRTYWEHRLDCVKDPSSNSRSTPPTYIPGSYLALLAPGEENLQRIPQKITLRKERS